MSQIYFIECSGYYKIGTSADVKSRVSQIQTANPYDVNLVAKVSVKNGTPGHVESALHSYYYPSHKSGEWFDLNPREAGGFKFIDVIDAEKLDSIVKVQAANTTLEQRGSLVSKLQEDTLADETLNAGRQTL